MTTEENLEAIEETPEAIKNAPTTWEDRRDQLLESAQELDADAALDCYCEAILLIDRKQPQDFQIAEVWGEVLRRFPGSAMVLWSRLGRQLSSTQEFWQQLSQVFEVASEGADGDDAARLNAAWGCVQLLRSGEAEAGKTRLAGVADADPSGLVAQLLEVVEVAESGNWRKLEKTITTQLGGLGLSDPELKIEALNRTADFALGAGAGDRAANIMQGLEKAKIARAEDSHRLCLLYRDIEKWNNYVGLLKSAVEQVEDPERKIDYHLEMVEVYRDHMKLDAMVVKSYEAIIEVDPGYGPAYDALEETYDGMRRYPDLVKLLQRRLKSAEGVDEKVDLNLKIANAYIEKLSRHANAIEFYENVLELVPLHEESIEALKDLYVKRREWEKLVALHRREIENLDDVEEQLVRLREVAEIATQRLRKSDLPVQVWRQILELSPEDAEAIDALEQLYRGKKDWANVAFVCERKAELSDDVQEKLRYWQEVGSLFGDRLDDSEGATRAWSQVIELDPAHSRATDSLRKLWVAAHAWEALEAFFGEREQWEELARLFEQETKKADGDAKIDLLFRAARVRGEELEQGDRAVKLVEAVFDTDAVNLRAATYLAPIYEDSGDAIQLSDMLAIQLQHLESPDDKLPLQLKLAHLFEDQIESPDSAYIWFAKALEEHPSEASAYDDLERVGAASEQFEDLVERLQVILEAVKEDDTLRRDVKLRIGRNLGDHLDKIDEARALFEEVLNEEPDNTRALAALEGLLERTGRFDDLIDVNKRRLDLTDDPIEQAEILLVAARIHEINRSDIPTAVEAYEQVRGLLPDDPRPLLELRRLFRVIENFSDLASVLRRHIELSLQALGAVEPKMVEVLVAVEIDDDGMPMLPEDAPEDAEPEIGDDGEIYVRLMRPEESDEGLSEPQLELLSLWFEMGEVARTELLDLTEAIEAYRQVLDLQLGHDEARHALEELLSEGSEAYIIACILEPAYIARGDFESLVRVLNVEIEHVEDPEARYELYVRVGLLLDEHLEDREAEAFEAYRQALAVKPENEDVQIALEGLAETLDCYDKLAEGLEDIAQNLDDVVLRTNYLLKLAEIQEQHIDDAEKALGYGRQALEIGREHEEVLASLEETFMRLGAWSDLVETIRGKEALAEEQADRLAFKLQIAEVTEGMLEDKEAAVEVYLEVVGEDPENDLALSTLDRLYEELERWADLASNLERRTELQEEDEIRDDIFCKLGQVLEKHLSEPGRAIDIFRDVLSRNPENEVAIAEMRGMLEYLPEQAEVIAEVLLPIYEATEDWLSQIEVKEQLLLAIEDSTQRIELLHSVAGLYEENSETIAEAAEDPEAPFRNAFDTYARALPIDPTNEHTLERLNSYAEALYAWEGLIEHFEAVVEEIVLDDVETAKMLLVRVAEIQTEPLEAFEAAIKAYERAYELDADDISVVEAMEALYEKLENWEALSETLSKKAGLIYETEPKKELLYKAAMIAEEMLEDKPRAIEVFREIFEFDGTDDGALDSLERLYAETEQWVELISIYSIKVDRTEDIEEKKEIFHLLGATQENKIEEVIDAIVTHKQVLDLDPDDFVSLDALDRLYLRSEDHFSLLEILEREEDLTEELEPKLRFRYRRGELLQVHLENVDLAIELYSSILDVEPSHADTVKALEGLIEEDEYGVRSAAVLEPIYRILEEWQKLVGAYEVLIGDADDIERQIQLLGNAAEVHEQELGDAQSALDTWLRALVVDPELDDIWENLLRLGSEYDFWEQLVERASGLLDELNEVPQVAAVVRNVATIYSDLLDRPDDAIAQWNRLLEFDDGNEMALDALDNLFETGERFDELTQVLFQKIERQYDPEPRIQLYYRLGMLYANFLEDGDQAIEQFREILLIERGQPDAIQALVELFGMGIGQIEISEILIPFYRENAEWSALVEIYLALLDHPDKSSDDRYSVLLEVANIYIDQLAIDDEAHLASAITVYGLALKERPDDALALAQIHRLAEETGYWSEAISAYQGAIPEAKEAHVKNELLWRTSKAFFDQLGDTDDAELYFLKFLGYSANVTDRQALLAAVAAREAGGGSTGEFEAEGGSTGEFEAEGGSTGEFEAEGGSTGEFEAEAPGEFAADGDSTGEFDVDLFGEPAAEGGSAGEFETEASGELEADSGFDLDMGFDEEAPIDSTPAEAIAVVEAAEASEISGDLALPEIERQVLPFLLAMDAEELSDDLEPERVLYALQCLDAVYETRDEAEELAEVLRQESRLVYDDNQVELMLRLGRTLHKGLGRIDEALEVFREVLLLDPIQLDALDAVADIQRDLGQWEAVYETLEMKADAVDDKALRARVRSQMATIAATELNRPEDAIEMLYQVISICEDSPLGQIEGLQGLELLYGQAENWDEYISVVERQIELYEEPVGMLEAHRKLGRLYLVTFEDIERALVSWLNAQETNPEDFETLRALKYIYEVQEQPGLIVETIRALLSLGQLSGEETLAHLIQLGVLLMEQLEEPEQSVEVWETIRRELDPNHAQSLDSLDRLYREVGRWQDAARVVEHKASLVGTLEERDALLIEASRVWAEHAEAFEPAAADLLAVLGNDPFHEVAFPQYEAVMRQFEQWQGMLDMYMERVNLSETPEGRLDYRQRAAGISQKHLDDAVGGFEIVIEALNESWRDKSLAITLEELAEETDQWGRLIESYNTIFEELEGSPEAILLHNTFGRWYYLKFDPPKYTESWQHFQEVLKVDGANLDAFEGLAEIYKRTNDPDNLIQIQTRRAELLDPEIEEQRLVKVRVYGELGELW